MKILVRGEINHLKKLVPGLAILLSLILLSLVGPLIYRIDPYQTNYEYKLRIYEIDLSNKKLLSKISLETSEVKRAVLTNTSIIILARDLLKIISLRTLKEIFEMSSVSDIYFDRNDQVLYVLRSSGELCLLDNFSKDLLIKNYACEKIPLRIDLGSINGFLVHRGEELVFILRNNSVYIYDLSSNHLEKIINTDNIYATKICGSTLLIDVSNGSLVTYDFSTKKINSLETYRSRINDIICYSNEYYLLGEKATLVIISSDGKIRFLPLSGVGDLVKGDVFGDKIYVISGIGEIYVINGSIDYTDLVYDANTKDLYVLDTDLVYIASWGMYPQELSPPSIKHLLGTDYFGRDLFAQVLIGIRMSLLIGLVTALIVLLIGGGLGVVAGYFRGRVDLVATSLINFMYSIPLEPFAIVLAIALKPGMITVILAISLLIWRTTARIIRSQTIVVSSLPMIEAAKALGASHTRIITRYIVPLVAPIAAIDFANVLIYSVLAEATLSFIGVGPSNIFTLGSILNTTYATGSWRLAWWTLTPGVFIGLIAWSLYLIVRSLEELLSPRLRIAQLKT